MRPAFILVLLAGAAALSGCSSIGRTLGVGKSVPDEFAVVSKAPLVVPPEYNLLPPRPGEPRPQELDSSTAARQALVGAASATNQSSGEQALVAEAGGLSADPDIRARIERESVGVVFKTASFTDRILFWQGSDDVDLAQDPLNPDAESERLRRQQEIAETTGGGEVRIQRRGGGVLKLPGL